MSGIVKTVKSCTVSDRQNPLYREALEHFSVIRESVELRPFFTVQYPGIQPKIGVWRQPAAPACTASGAIDGIDACTCALAPEAIR